MKRSEINAALREMERMISDYRISLPPFCNFTPEQWQTVGHDYDEVRDCMLGWDITDYGLGKFDEVGFSLITIRNGNRAMPDKYPKVYAEKLLYLKEGQYSPNHFHWHKTEDIINRGGGNVLIRVYNSLPDEEIDYKSDVAVHTDGRAHTVPAGAQVRLTPGESIHIYQRLYHDFTVEPGTGAVLLGEVSQCNDDNTDNRFNPPVGRFPEIEEDEPPYRLLCGEYPPRRKRPRCPDDAYTRELESAAEDIRRDEKWRVDYMLLSEKLRENRRLGRYTQSVAQARKFRGRFGADELAEICFVSPQLLQAILDAIDAHPDWDDETVAEHVDFE